jgi:hypothetical protein
VEIRLLLHPGKFQFPQVRERLSRLLLALQFPLQRYYDFEFLPVHCAEVGTGVVLPKL